ncbi:hypothetical protein CHUAL_007985 [Chamberlinius hualienensis]
MALFTKFSRVNLKFNFSTYCRLFVSNKYGIPDDFYSKYVRDPVEFKSVKYWVDNRVGHIQLNRPQRLNAIDYYMPLEIQAAVELANGDKNVKVILLDGANNSFCSGYDLKLFAEGSRGENPVSQKIPWDPYIDYTFMSVAIGGGSDLALSADVIFMAEEAKIGYPPVRVWGCPTTAMWVYRVGIERAKRIMFTGDLLTGLEAVKIGLVGQAEPEDKLDETKQVINNAVEMMGLASSQRLATFLDGMTRHTPEGLAFQSRAQQTPNKTLNLNLASSRVRFISIYL